MKYVNLHDGEYKINKDVKDFKESVFNDEINQVKEAAVVKLDVAIVNMFLTPLALLALTFIPVVVTSILVIALGVIMDTSVFYIFLGVAYLLWGALLVIVLIERKNKNKYFKNPVIHLAKITNKDYVRKNGYLLEFDLYINGNIDKERMFLKTNLSSKKTKQIKKSFCETLVNEDNIFVMIYSDQKRRCFPVRLFKKQ